jgi:hypothetical protein
MGDACRFKLGVSFDSVLVQGSSSSKNEIVRA